MHSTQKLPDGYHYLKVGTKIKQGDKWFCPINQTWLKSQKLGFNVLYIKSYIRANKPKKVCINLTPVKEKIKLAKSLQGKIVAKQRVCPNFLYLVKHLNYADSPVFFTLTEAREYRKQEKLNGCDVSPIISFVSAGTRK